MPSERLVSQEQTKRNSVPHMSLDNQQQTEVLTDQTRSELEREFLFEVRRIRPKNLRDILCLYFYTYVKPDKDLTESHLRKPHMMPGIRAIKNRLKCSDRKALDMLRTINVAHRFLSQEEKPCWEKLMDEAKEKCLSDRDQLDHLHDTGKNALELPRKQVATIAAEEMVECHRCHRVFQKNQIQEFEGLLYCKDCAGRNYDVRRRHLTINSFKNIV